MSNALNVRDVRFDCRRAHNGHVAGTTRLWCSAGVAIMARHKLKGAVVGAAAVGVAVAIAKSNDD